jgi:hypothetical protein
MAGNARPTALVLLFLGINRPRLAKFGGNLLKNHPAGVVFFEESHTLLLFQAAAAVNLKLYQPK